MDEKAVAKLKLGPLPRFTTIGPAELANIMDALGRPLSGYLGGIRRGGYWIERLAGEWSEKFQIKHSIPCNSATSGLLAACMAVGIGPGDPVWVSNYTMSATAACAKVLGADVRFVDIESGHLQLNPYELLGQPNKPFPKAVIVTNLHGHPARLREIRGWCNKHSVWMIEDNAQSPMAQEHGRFAGTVGHIGVFSLNVHKHIQCGEGGVIVTDSDTLADKLQDAINHGELAEYGPGLNLRMAEVTAAIACSQLSRASQYISGRIALAQAMDNMIEGIDWIRRPMERFDCRHVYYMWCPMIDMQRKQRFIFLAGQCGLPFGESYPRMHKIFGSNEAFPTTDAVDARIATFEICAYDPSEAQIKKMKDIVYWAAEGADGAQAQKSG